MAMRLLSEFAEKWKLKIEGERIPGYYGFIMECNGQLWCWTHSHTPDYGHRFFAIGFSPSDTGWDEVKAVYFVVGPDGPKMKEPDAK
jgi:hypothetical protein